MLTKVAGKWRIIGGMFKRPVPGWPARADRLRGLPLCIVAAIALALSGCADSPDSSSAPDSSETFEDLSGNDKTDLEPSRATMTQHKAQGPYLRALGTVQDGGLPHAACHCERCEVARHDESRRRWVASLGIVLPAANEVFLIDATPDIRQQLDRLADVRQPPDDRVDRAPVDGVLLTHAHIGHYLGLAFFGFEAIHSQQLPVFATPAMAGFLRNNGPWDQLVELGNIDLLETRPGTLVGLGDGVRVSPIQVPHRDEYADTVGFVIQGPERRVLYVPDTDSWDAWDPSLPTVLEDIDVAILDGSFYSLAELPGRDLASVKHPLITITMDLLQPQVDAGKLEVFFSHLNHSNPALQPESSASREIEQRGFHVLAEGQEIAL